MLPVDRGFDHQAVFLVTAILALPVIVTFDRSVDLDAGRGAMLEQSLGDFAGLVLVGNGGQANQDLGTTGAVVIGGRVQLESFVLEKRCQLVTRVMQKLF